MQKKLMKFINNENILNETLYGKLKEGDLAKNHIVDGVIENEKTKEKLFGGSLIITRESIARDIIEEFNTRQKNHIKNHTMAHKDLCERREEAIALTFITLKDLFKDHNILTLSPKEKCDIARENIQNIIETELEWMLNYSKHIVRDYYSINSNRLKIKLNYILDDGKYDNEENEKRGGLLLNGIIDELIFYEEEMANYINENIGMICQILGPTGLPRNKKWIQVDVGVSAIGKRLYLEDLNTTIMRKSKEQIHITVTDDVVNNPVGKLYYYGAPLIKNYNGCEIHIWEVLYPDQINLIDEKDLCYNFCECLSRNKIINDHKVFLRKINN